MRPNSIPEGHLLISLDTREAVNAEQALAFMRALLFQLRQTPEIGASARIEIVHLSRGTIWAQVAIIVGTLVVGTGVIQVAVDSIRAELENGRGPFAKETARTLTVYGGDNCTILTGDHEFTVNLQMMPAKEIIDREPSASPVGFSYLREGEAYLQEDGEFIVEPNGKPEPPQRSADNVKARLLRPEEAATAEGGEAEDSDNARQVALIGQLEDSFGTHTFEFMAKNGDTYFAEEADDFADMVALGQDVFIEATLVEREDGPLLYVHRLRVID